MSNDDLSKRMKGFYETVPKTKLMRRTPVIIRLDGKAFHTFTKGFDKPFDEMFLVTMQNTMRFLCENIENCKLGYTQSDEITLLLIDYDTFETGAWFDYEVQKMCSVSSSLATYAFNRCFSKLVAEEQATFETNTPVIQAHLEAHCERLPLFDARVFNIPREEVTNCFYWRQWDASKNSVASLTQKYFTQKALDGKNIYQQQDMLMTRFNVNWNNLETYKKRGSCAVRGEYAENSLKERFEIPLDLPQDEYTEFMKDKTIRNGWIIDREIPIFKGDGREYVEKYLYPDED